MQELRDIYQRRKQQLLPLAFGFAAFFVLFRIILPQWSDIQDTQQLLLGKSADVKTLQSNVDLLSSIPTNTVDKNFTTATTALPVGKDIILIFNELSDAAQRANVILGGFSVQVGGIYSQGKNAVSANKSIDGIPYLNILVSATGDNFDLRQFANILYQSTPLVEIDNVDIQQTSARYDVNFYFKPVSVNSVSATLPIAPLGVADNAELKQLNGWMSSTSSIASPTPALTPANTPTSTSSSPILPAGQQ